MSPELHAAIAAADTEKPSPAYDRRGFFMIGPRYFGPSDLLIAMLWYLMADGSATYCANVKPSIVEARRARRITDGRRAFERNTPKAKRRRYPSHGPAEFYGSLA